jgi:serine protease Do
MKQLIMKKFVIAGFALLVVPAAVFAQKEYKVKDDKNDSGVQSITITRTANLDGKTVIEIDGNKVKVNGKDASDNKDVQVNVNTIKGAHVRNWSNHGANFSFDTNNMTLMSDDENRAFLGVVTEGEDKGAEIQSVTKESAAEKAGLKKGDIITNIDGKKIDDMDDVTDVIHDHKPGDKVPITFLRDGKEQKVTAELGRWKGVKMGAVSFPRINNMNMDMDMNWEGAEPPTAYGPKVYAFGGGRPKLGLSIQDTDDGKGVKVLDVDDESAAEKAGLKEGDIITGIDDKEVKSTDDVTRTIRESKDKYTFNFKVLRNGKAQNMDVKMPKKLKTADL